MIQYYYKENDEEKIRLVIFEGSGQNQSASVRTYSTK